MSRVLQAGIYQKFHFWPGHEGTRRGQFHDSTFHRVYINQTLYNALPSPSRVAPYGSIIVKESLSSDKQVTFLFVMVKAENYNPEGNDWYWAKATKEGKIVAAGKLKACIDCHAGQKNNDFVMIRPLDRAVDPVTEESNSKKYIEN